jgi:hypothetical protein
MHSEQPVERFPNPEIGLFEDCGTSLRMLALTFHRWRAVWRPRHSTVVYMESRRLLIGTNEQGSTLYKGVRWELAFSSAMGNL